MSDRGVKCKILSDKALQLLSKISEAYDESGRLSSEDCPKSSTLSEENMVFKTHVTWVINLSQLNEKSPGKCIESSHIEVSSPEISYIWFRLYPKGKNTMSHEKLPLTFSVHFRYLPENVFVECEVALVDHTGDVFLKEIFSDDARFVERKTIDFFDFSASETIKHKQREGKLKEQLFVQCRIKLLSRIYTCVTDKLTYTVKMTPKVNNLYSDILKSGKYSDVTLSAESKEIKAHKFILATESPTLHISMKVNRRDVLELDGKYRLLQNLLRYIYAGEFRIFNFSDAVDYYSTSYKYEVLNLKNLCTAYLSASLTEKNVSYVLDLSRTHEDKYLINACLAFLKSHNVDDSAFLKRHF